MKEKSHLCRPQTTRSVKSGHKHGTEDSFAKIATPAAFTEAASGQAHIKIICGSCLGISFTGNDAFKRTSLSELLKPLSRFEHVLWIGRHRHE